MTILLTNDDGLDAPGLEVLERVLGADHDLWVVAPDREKSGASHGITLLEGIKVLQHGDKRFSVAELLRIVSISLYRLFFRFHRILLSQELIRAQTWVPISCIPAPARRPEKPRCTTFPRWRHPWPHSPDPGITVRPRDSSPKTWKIYSAFGQRTDLSISTFLRFSIPDACRR
jgi:hypothetical protein